MTVKILAVGDVCGTVGLDFLHRVLKNYKEKNGIDFCVVNGENANVVGVTPRQCDSILRAGADVVTLGNHTWTRWELQPYLDESRRVIRPANFGPQCPGAGDVVINTDFGKVEVINLIGKYGLDANTDNPFLVVDSILQEPGADIILVDFHAEATSEKVAMGHFLDGRVSAVWGTHTHVQTSDAMVLPKGTGYITDLGMTGPIHSVIGIPPQQSIETFLGGLPGRYQVAKGECKLCGAIFTLDSATGLCRRVERVDLTDENSSQR